MKSLIKYVSLLALIALGATLFYVKVYIPKTTYESVTPSMGALHVSVRGIGNVSAKDIYAITAQSGGKILAIHTDAGEWVKKGDLLIEMDGVDLPAQLAIAHANVEKSKYDIKALESDLLNQMAQKKLLQITYDRYLTLQKQKFVSQSEIDKAKADVESIDAAITASKAHIDAAKAALIVASKSIDALNVKIDRLHVKAPSDGYIVEKKAQVAQSVVPSTPILTLIDASTLWVVSKIDERISAKIQEGQHVKIHLRSQPDKVYEGEVARINAMSDAVTLEREVDIAFKELPKPFYINEQAQVEIVVNNLEGVVKIPSNLVVQNGGKLGVWLKKEGRAQFQSIDIIGRGESEVALKTMDEHTQIIVPNSHKKTLYDGMKIH